MRYKYLLWDVWVNKDDSSGKDIKIYQKVAISTFGLLFIFGEPDISFLPKYYKAFPIKDEPA